MTTYKASVASTREANVYQAQVRDFKIKYDLTGRRNGYEKGLDPKEALLCALGACESIVAGSFYRKQHFTYRSFYLVLNGTINGDRPGFDEIKWMLILIQMSRKKIQKSLSNLWRIPAQFVII